MYEIEDTIPMMRMNKIASTQLLHITVLRPFIYFNDNLAILYLFFVVAGPFHKVITIQIQYAVVCIGLNGMCAAQRNVYAALLNMRLHCCK